MIPGLGKVLLLGIGAVMLAACEQLPSVDDLNPFAGKRKKPAPACPSVNMLQDADKLVFYRSGGGRDITDIVFQAEITGFTGDCQYVRDDKDNFTAVNLTLQVSFDVSQGPAIRARGGEIGYFIAIPDFFPRAEGRREFTRKFVFPENRNDLSMVDGKVEVNIPLEGGRTGADTDIYIGFVLTRDQLENNRKRRANSRLGR